MAKTYSEIAKGAKYKITGNGSRTLGQLNYYNESEGNKSKSMQVRIVLW